jgi:hypothetical protein
MQKNSNYFKKGIISTIGAMFLCLSSITSSFAQMGTALNFDGVNDHVVLANESTFDLPTTLTIEVRAFTPAVLPGGVHSLINKRTLTENANFGINFSSTILFFYFNDGAFRLTSVDPALIPLNQWVHFAYTLEQVGADVRARAYINGTQVGTDLWVGANLSNAQNNDPVRLGTLTADREFFQGSMDEVRIWNIVRTQPEIDANKNCQFATTPAGLIGYYNFNQGTGSNNNAGFTTLSDFAGTPDNGTLNGFSLNGATSNWVSDLILTPCLAAAPTVTSIAPTTAGVDATITITGTNFLGASAVTIGGVAARSFCVIDNTTIRAITGNGIAAGASDVTVTNGGTGTLTNGFTGIVVPNGAITGQVYTSVGGFQTLRVSVTPSAQARQAIRYREAGAGETGWRNTTVDGAATTIDVPGLKAGTVYEIYLQTQNVAGHWSNRTDPIVNAGNSGAGTFCSPTTAAAAGVTGTTVTFNWAAQTSATRYLIRYWEMASAQGACLATAISGTTISVFAEGQATNSLQVQGLKANTSYAYDVQVYCGAVATGRSNVITFNTTAGATCSAPTNVTLAPTTVNNYAAFNVSWTGQSNITSGSPKFIVFYKATGSPDNLSVITDATSATLTGLLASTQYDVRVLAFCEGGNLLFSNVFQATTSAATNNCPAVTASASTPVNGAVFGADLSWTGGTFPQTGRTILLGYSRDLAPTTVWWYSTNQNTFQIRSNIHQDIQTGQNYTYRLQQYCDGTFAGYGTNNGAFTTGSNSIADKNTDSSISTTQGVATELVVYPNPSIGEVNIAYTSATNGEVHLTVVDVLGREVYKQTANGALSVKLDNKTLGNGFYVAKVSENGQVVTKKFIVQ